MPDEAGAVQAMLRAAQALPQAGTLVHICPVQKSGQLQALKALFPYARGLWGARQALCLSFMPGGAACAAAAAEGMMLAAGAYGADAVRFALWPWQERMAAVRQLLSLPGEAEPLCLLALRAGKG